MSGFPAQKLVAPESDYRTIKVRVVASVLNLNLMCSAMLDESQSTSSDSSSDSDSDYETESKSREPMLICGRGRRGGAWRRWWSTHLGGFRKSLLQILHRWRDTPPPVTAVCRCNRL